MGAGSVKRDDSGAWFFVVDLAGADGRRKQLKRRGFDTKKAAQTALSELAADLRSGTYVKPERTTVAEYLRDWLAGLPAAGRRTSTITSYAQNVRHNINPKLGVIELQALTAVQLDALYSELLGRGLSMSSVRKVHTIVGKALHDAERRGIVARNVARLATPPAASASVAPEMRYWTPAELRSFLAAIDDHHHYPLLRLAAMTGMRRGELCGLRWVDIDVEAGTIKVRKSITAVSSKRVAGDVKTKRSRRVLDVDPATMAVVRRWRKEQLEQRMLMGAGWRDTGLVFTDPTGDGWHPDTISQAFDRLVTPASRAKRVEPSWSRIRLHDLRHSHATHLLAAGVNIKVVSERLGHASVAFTLDTYAHVMPGQQADAAASVAALVGFT